jgi:hypothetical protein
MVRQFILQPLNTIRTKTHKSSPFLMSKNVQTKLQEDLDCYINILYYTRGRVRWKSNKNPLIDMRSSKPSDG